MKKPKTHRCGACGASVPCGGAVAPQAGPGRPSKAHEWPAHRALLLRAWEAVEQVWGRVSWKKFAILVDLTEKDGIELALVAGERRGMTGWQLRALEEYLDPGLREKRRKAEQEAHDRYVAGLYGPDVTP